MILKMICITFFQYIFSNLYISTSSMPCVVIFKLIFIAVPKKQTQLNSHIFQNSLKSTAEFRIENRIDNRIKSRIGISQPSQHFESSVWNAILAKSGHNVDDEKGSPTK